MAIKWSHLYLPAPEITFEHENTNFNGTQSFIQRTDGIATARMKFNSQGHLYEQEILAGNNLAVIRSASISS